jgi:hypothetical protein
MKRQVNDMERLVQEGMNLAALKPHEIAEICFKLMEYYDTGYESQTIANLDKICRDQSNSIFRLGKEMEKRHKELEKTKKENITYSNQLSMLRIWFNSLGTTLEKVLEDCNTTSPSTTDAP